MCVYVCVGGGLAQRDLFHRWACPLHERAMPHIKTYCRYDADASEAGARRLHWFVLTSANLSKVARLASPAGT
jgi:hypothetical protein